MQLMCFNRDDIMNFYIHFDDVMKPTVDNGKKVRIRNCYNFERIYLMQLILMLKNLFQPIDSL